jgi:hypothetical protein
MAIRNVGQPPIVHDCHDTGMASPVVSIGRIVQADCRYHRGQTRRSGQAGEILVEIYPPSQAAPLEFN